MQRRQFLKSSSTLMGALPLLNSTPSAIFNTSLYPDAEVFKTTIGKFQCTLFRDFMFKYQAKDFFINAKEEELNQSLNKYNTAPDNIPSPFIALLIQQEGRKILVDTGVGFSEKPVSVRGNSVYFKGRLHQLLVQQNISKKDITDVIITHFHPDHIGGVFSDDEKLNFPNARFYIHEHEWNYWHSPASDNQPGQFKYFIEKNITKLKAHNLNLFKEDWIDLIPGITAVKAKGHTPGQVALIIHSEKQHLLYISDAILHPLHIEHIDWQTNYDLNHEEAKQSRIKLLELAHKENMLVNAFHFDFPGLGRIDKLGNNWIWKYSEK